MVVSVVVRKYEYYLIKNLVLVATMKSNNLLEIPISKSKKDNYSRKIDYGRDLQWPLKIKCLRRF